MSDVTLASVTDKAVAVCEQQQWKRSWLEAGCYLHLEASEFIEALRGKGDEPPENEAADVLFVLLSTLRAHHIDPHLVLGILDAKCDAILSGARQVPFGGSR